MYSVSNAFLEEVKKPVQTHRVQGTIGSYSFDKGNIVSGTFHITNQCTDTSDVVLGSVYMGQLECTFTGLNIGYTNWIGKTITPTFGLKMGENTWEDIPLGVYRVIEAEHTAEGVHVVAYDNMRKLDRKFRKSHYQGTKTLLEFVAILCADCNIALGMTDEEFNSLPNTGEQYEMFGLTRKTKAFATDIDTCRDLLFWIAQTMGCFATMDRMGQLVFRKYNSTIVDTISQNYRLTGAEFADYITNYTGIYVNNMRYETESYYGYDAQEIQAEITIVSGELEIVDDDIQTNRSALVELERKHDAHEITDEEYLAQKAVLDEEYSTLTKRRKQLQKHLNWLAKALEKAQAGEDGTSMDLGDNPFLQDENATVRERERRRVLKSIDKISYTPFACSSVMGIHYDLGDVLYFTGGHAGSDGVFCCLMMYDWTFNGGYQMQGFGADPSIANVKDRVEKTVKKANENALNMARSTVGVSDTSNEPYGKDGDFYFTEPLKEYKDPNSIHENWGHFRDITESLQDNVLNITAQIRDDNDEFLAYKIEGLEVGKTYHFVTTFRQDGDPTKIWNQVYHNCIAISTIRQSFTNVSYDIFDPTPNAVSTFEYADGNYATGVSLYFDTDEHTYEFDYEAKAETSYIILSLEKYRNGTTWGGVNRNIFWTMENYWTNNIPFTTMRYYDESKGGWIDLDYVAKTEENEFPDEKSGVGLVVENKVIKLKPNVMRAWFKADPPQVKRTFNQYCVRFTGKPESNVEITLQNNNGWLNKSIKKDSEGVFTLKSGGTVSSEVIEYCAYKITGLTSGQRYYFNFKANFKDGTTFGGDFTKGLGVVFNTTGIISTDDWEGDPGTFDEENLYCSFRRGTVGTFYDFSFVATASTMYMCVVVADITSGQTSSLTLSRMVISKTERAYVRDFYIFDIVSNDWLPYKPWGSGSGGGDAGASSLGDLDDVNLDNLANGQCLFYDEDNGEWVNENFPVASANNLGGIKVGQNLSIDANGVLSAQAGGVSDYDDLLNRPQVNNITLTGNKTSADLGIVITLTQAQYNALTTEQKNDPNKVYYITDASGGGGASTLDELDDVEIVTPTNGQVLKYDSANSKWVNGDDEGCLFTVVNGKVCITYEE